MHCYLCLAESDDAEHAACGICQWCGAGVCQYHMRELKKQQPVGMAGGSFPGTRYTLICLRCYNAAVAGGNGGHQSGHRHAPRLQAARPWWKIFGRRPAADESLSSSLPSPEEAVATVERILQRDSSR